MPRAGSFRFRDWSSGGTLNVQLGFNPGTVLLLRKNRRFELLDIVKTLRPQALTQADEASDHLGDALDEHQRRAERNERLERPDRHAGGAVDSDLPDEEGRVGVRDSIDQKGEKAGKEEYDIEDELDACLRPRVEQPVDHVASHMAVA